MTSNGIHLKAISLEIPPPPFAEVSLKITYLKLNWDPPGANELKPLGIAISQSSTETSLPVCIIWRVTSRDSSWVISIYGCRHKRQIGCHKLIWGRIILSPPKWKRARKHSMHSHHQTRQNIMLAFLVMTVIAILYFIPPMLHRKRRKQRQHSSSKFNLFLF